MSNNTDDSKIVSVKRSYRRFTSDEKQRILEKAAKPNVSIGALCQEYGISRALLNYWQTTAVRTAETTQQKHLGAVIRRTPQPPPRSPAARLYRTLLGVIPHAEKVTRFKHSPEKVYLQSILFPEREISIYTNWLNRKRVYLELDGDSVYYFDTFDELTKLPLAVDSIADWLGGKQLDVIRKKLEVAPEIYFGNYKDIATLQIREVMLAALPQATIDTNYNDEGEPKKFYLRSILFPQRVITVDVTRKKTGILILEFSLDIQDTDSDGTQGFASFIEFQTPTVEASLSIITDWFTEMPIDDTIKKAKSQIGLLKKVVILIE